MDLLLQPFFGLEPWLFYGLLGALVVGESAALFAVVLPAELALVGVGLVVARGQASLTVAIVVAVIATVAGSAIGYEIGRRSGTRPLDSALWRRHPRALELAAAALASNSGLAVLVSRWTSAGRIVVPRLAGAYRVPYPRFAGYNVVGGVVWVVTFVALGTYAGASLDAVGPIAWVLTGLAAAGIVVGWATRRLRRPRRRSATADVPARSTGATGPSPFRIGA